MMISSVHLLPCRRFVSFYLTRRMTLLLSLSFLWLTVSATASSHETKDASAAVHEQQVKVEFYGEALCPLCRQFVTQAWPTVWNDADLKALVDYTMVPWGNAYFATAECGGLPFNKQTMTCWYQHCVEKAADDDNDKDCFTGQAIYQHDKFEGLLDQYESCVLHELGLDAGVAFAACVEGPLLEQHLNNVSALVASCLDESLAPAMQDCVQTQGRALEVRNAKQTPRHLGVPVVLVNGKPADDPMTDIKTAVCQAVPGEARPTSCKSTTNTAASSSSSRATNVRKRQVMILS